MCHMGSLDRQRQPLGCLGAARVLGITRRQVLRLVEVGALVPAAKMDGVTGAYLFDPADVEALRTARLRAERAQEPGTQRVTL